MERRAAPEGANSIEWPIEMGRASEADDQYEALTTYYPDFPALKHYLRQISLMEVINLRA